MPDSLHFTDSDEANALIASDPMALLIGFALDQQVSVQKAFMGPLVLRERLGTLDASALADADLDAVGRVGQSGDRVDRGVGDQLAPLVGPDVVRDRALEARARDQTLNVANRLGRRAGRADHGRSNALAQRAPVADGQAGLVDPDDQGNRSAEGRFDCFFVA